MNVLLAPYGPGCTEIQDFRFIPQKNARGREMAWQRWNDENDAMMNMGDIPYTGVGYYLVDTGFADKVRRFSPLLDRLFHIRQLGFLHPPIVSEFENEFAGQYYQHTRFIHSFDVAALLLLIATKNKLPEEFVSNLYFAGLTHDVYTPAGGDSTKQIDPTAFNEETLYPRIFKEPGWEQLKKEYTLDEHLLAEGVQSRGLLGQLLDVADKLAYTGRDLSICYRGQNQLSMWGDETIASLRLLNMTLAVNLFPCDLWETVTIENNQIVFENQNRLLDFLLVRALMFRFLYYNPSGRFVEDMVIKLLMGYLYKTEKVSRDQLLKMTDQSVNELIGQYLPKSSLVSWVNIHGDPRLECFNSLEEAKEGERQLARDCPELLTYSTTLPTLSTSFRNWLVRQGDKVVPLYEADPAGVAELGTIASAGSKACVYYQPMEDLGIIPELKEYAFTERTRRLAT